MRMHFRLPILFIGPAAILCFSFAALAQTPVGSAAKQDDAAPSIYAQLGARLFSPRPRGCFCDEDCFAAMLEKEKKQRFQSILTWSTVWQSATGVPPVNHAQEARATFKLHHYPSWSSLYPTAENEIRVIDFDGLKKFLQRDPKDPRPLLINFWATWCDPCREEFPDLVKLDVDYRSKGLNFLAISLDDISDVKTVVPKFLKEMKAEMPVVLLNVNDPEPAIKAVDATWDGQLPATFLYDKEGKVVFKHFGRIEPAALRAAIDKAIGNKQ